MKIGITTQVTIVQLDISQNTGIKNSHIKREGRVVKSSPFLMHKTKAQVLPFGSTYALSGAGDRT